MIHSGLFLIIGLTLTTINVVPPIARPSVLQPSAAPAAWEDAIFIAGDEGELPCQVEPLRPVLQRDLVGRSWVRPRVLYRCPRGGKHTFLLSVCLEQKGRHDFERCSEPRTLPLPGKPSAVLSGPRVPAQSNRQRYRSWSLVAGEPLEAAHSAYVSLRPKTR